MDGRSNGARRERALRPCKCAITTPVCVCVCVCARELGFCCRCCMCFFSSTYTVTKPVALSGSLRVRDHSLVLHTWASRGRRRNAVCLIRLFHMDVYIYIYARSSIVAQLLLLGLWTCFFYFYYYYYYYYYLFIWLGQNGIFFSFF